MKRTFIAVMLLLALSGPSDAARHYFATCLTGGTSGCLDAIDITGALAPNQFDLSDGDAATVMVLTGTDAEGYHYIFDIDGTDAESSPDIIRPDDFSAAGVWRLDDILRPEDIDSEAELEAVTGIQVATETEAAGYVTTHESTYDHVAALGSAAERDAEDTLTDGPNLPDGAAIIAYGNANWATGTGDLKADGTVSLSDNWDAGAYEIRAQTFESDVATGTAPFTVASTTVTTNLNADLLDGESATAFEDADTAIVKSDEAETITTQWDFANNAPTVPGEAYDATGWDGDDGAPTKNDVRDKFESFTPDAFTVKTDAAATASYLGTNGTDGAIRAGTNVTIADGGDYMTISASLTGGTVDTDGTLNADEIAVMYDLDTIKSLTESEFKAAYNMQAGVDYQTYNANLVTYAGITPSANVQSLLGSVDYAAMAVLQESANEGAMELQDMQGAVTDAQVPNGITIDLATVATTATTANAGDSATAFFSSGEIEDARIPNDITIDLATTATTATTANAGDSATAFFSSGTVEHERGGLEANVSGYSGLVGITAGATTEVDTESEFESFAGFQVATETEAAGYVTTHASESDPHTGYLKETDLEETPTNGETEKAPTSNWAYDMGVTVAAIESGGLFTGETRTAMTTDDTTPQVASGNLYDCSSTGAMTITDFNDGTDHTGFSAGDYFGLYMDDPNVTIDFSANSNIEGNADTDYTGSSSSPRLFVFSFDADDDTWYSVNFNAGMSSPTELSIDAIAVDTVIDTAAGTYTTSELMGYVLSNYGDTNALEMEFPARSEGWNFKFIIEAAQNVTLDPNGTEAWYLNGTQGSAGQAIVNESPTIGELLECFSTQNNVFCESDYSDWAFDTGVADVVVRPTTDYNAHWTCSTGTDRYAMVDEATADDETTYMYRQNSSTNQLFSNLPTLSAGTILGVSIHYVDREIVGDSTTGFIQMIINGTTYTGSGEASTSTYTARSEEWTTNPDTGSAWTQADIEGTGSNPIQAWGMSCSVGTGEEMRITQVYMVVRYN